MRVVLKLIFWLLVAVICFSVLAFGLFGTSLRSTRPVSDFRNWMGARARSGEDVSMVNEQYSEDAALVDKIEINMAWANAKVMTTTDSQIRVELTGVRSDEFEVRRSNSTYYISQNEYRRGFWRFLVNVWDWRSQPYVRVYVPESYARDIKIRMASGDTTIQDDMTLGELSIDTASGNITLDGNIKSRYASFKMASGDLNANEVRGEEVRLDSASGNIRLTAVESERFSFNLASGDLRVGQLAGEGDIAMMSGRVDLHFTQVTGPISLSTVSGDVTLSLPADADVFTDVSMLSGSVRNDFSRSDGRYRLGVKGTSGDIDIIAR